MKKVLNFCSHGFVPSLSTLISAVPIAVMALALTGRALAASPAEEAKAIIQTAGIKGGLVVHLGAGDGQLTTALRVNDSYHVQGLEPDAAKVSPAREYVRSKGAYGQVSVDRLQGNELPYIDGLVNLVVAEDLKGVPMAEVMRILAPNGVACIKKNGQWTKTVKPRPANIDDWTHYYYDAKGNAVSKDEVVGPPERLQWVGSPRWSRHHDRMSSLSAQISTGGRLFYIMDEGSRISILLPSKWFLTARDAYNGMILWRKTIPLWNTQMWPLKSGPTQLTRRLVGAGDNIFVTLAIDAPVSQLDGATGEPVRVYEETRGAEEILHVDGIIYVLANPNPWVLTDFAPKFNTGDQKRVETEFNWDEKPRDLMAVDTKTGKVLWKNVKTKVAPLTLATDGKRIVYHDGDKLMAIDPKTGKELWNSGPAAKRKLFEFNYGPRLLIHGDVVLYAGGDGAMKGYDAASGKELWSAPHNKSGYRSPEDLIVSGGLVWNAPTLSGSMSGAFSGRDPKTGETKVEFAPDVDTYWFHHRCYIAKATEKYLLPSRTGIEFVDPKTKHWDINHWVRAACLYGVMPCNGLVFAGPHNCACYPEAKLDGMNALAPAGPTSKPKVLPDEQRLERGPAYGQPITETDAHANDWPTYRHDNTRSGYTANEMDQDLSKAWSLNLGGRLSAVTVAAGMAFVAQVDEHTLHAVDEKTGKQVWHFIAGARIDSPPTYWKGRVLFGSMDGYVYCVRATDGALIWRFLGSPMNCRHVAFEQVESVWPVHGSVLVADNTVNFVAGRSVFLDGGMRFLRLDAATGKKLVETVMDDKDPETGKDLQELVKTLQMPVGLNDILSTDDKYIYLRSQKIQKDGKRVDIAPVSGNAMEQGGAQKGEGAHIFAPMGFLDDSWFHRSYWVYGKHFAGGHNGYYQAGKYTPSGRILVFDDKNVYSYGREAQYFKWTTTMEHQLAAMAKEAPGVEPVGAGAEGGKKKKGKGKAAATAAAPAAPGVPSVKFADSDKFNPAGTPLTVEAWILPDGPDGIIVAHGGAVQGYALALDRGTPAFAVRVASQGAIAVSARQLDEGWHHLVGVITAEKRIQLYVDGQLAAEAASPGLLASRPKVGLQLGSMGTSEITEHGRSAPYTGLLDQFAIYGRALDVEEIVQHANGTASFKSGKDVKVAASFDNGDARDESGNGINGAVSGVETGKGKVGAALWFRKVTGAAPAIAGPGGNTAPPPGTFVENKWANRIPIVTRAMSMAGSSLFVSGPKDIIDEEYAFERLMQKDPAIQAELAEQDAILDGKRGALMWLVSPKTGEFRTSVNLESPPVWDGMAIAQGSLFVSSVDGKLTRYGGKK